MPWGTDKRTKYALILICIDISIAINKLIASILGSNNFPVECDSKGQA